MWLSSGFKHADKMLDPKFGDAIINLCSRIFRMMRFCFKIASVGSLLDEKCDLLIKQLKMRSGDSWMFADMRPMFLNAPEHRILNTYLKTKVMYQIYSVEFNPLRIKMYQSDLKTQLLSCSKHFLPRL